MPSKSFSDFKERLTEVEQILDAHGALVRLRKAEDAIASVGGNLAKIGDVINALISKPGPGRPPEVHALNSSAIALLSGHLQGFVTDLYAESAEALLTPHVPDVQSVIDSAPTRGNPNEQNINRLFGTIGIADVLDGIGWNRMSNASLKRKLREFNELRNRIVHGKSETVRKAQVTTYASIWKNFARKLDGRLRREIKKKTGKDPWP